MKTVVVYNSKTGFTERYGNWIAHELGCKAVKYKDMTPEQWKENDTIIYGGGIMAGKINGLDKMKARPEVENKKLVVYGVGAAPIEREVIDKIKNNNLTMEEQNRIPFFYFEGGINYEKMSFFPKLMLKTMHKILKNKKEKTEEDAAMAQLFEKSSDSSSKEYIIPLLKKISDLK